MAQESRDVITPCRPTETVDPSFQTRPSADPAGRFTVFEELHVTLKVAASIQQREEMMHHRLSAPSCVKASAQQIVVKRRPALNNKAINQSFDGRLSE